MHYRRELYLAFIASIAACAVARRDVTCGILDFGAVPGNHTVDALLNSRAIQQAFASCEQVIVPPRLVFKLAPIKIPSHTVLYLSEGSVLVGSDDPAHYGIVHFLPPMGNSLLQLQPLVSNDFCAVNVTIVGMNGTIDGNGWFAWPSGNWMSCVKLGSPCEAVRSFGEHKSHPPHVITFSHCTTCNMHNVTVTNPAYWGVQHFFSNDTTMTHVTILAPRWTREIAGFMPFSVRGYKVMDSYVAVGDDAVAIMSGPDFANGHGCPAEARCPVAPVTQSQPTAGIIFQRLFVLGRSVAIGSEDFGNVTDVLFEDCTIGDDEGSSPWAFKIKMHSNVGCRVGDIVVRNTKFGRISNNTWQDPGSFGGTAIYIQMTYGDDAPVDISRAQPEISNISFINVTATATREAGHMIGAVHQIEGLHFKDCNFHSSSPKPWHLVNISTSTCTSINTFPDPFSPSFVDSVPVKVFV